MDLPSHNLSLQQTPLTLTDAELIEVTGYRRAAEQLAWFKALGVPAKRRADGTVSVGREHYLHLVKPTPRMQEFRPSLKSDRQAP